jgi:hypothetical protein
MSALQEKSARLFERFAEKLGNIDLSVAVAIPAAIGAVAMLSGAALEEHGQMNLLMQHGGIASLAAYKASLASEHISSFSDWLADGMKGKLLSFGGNTEARGFATMTVAPLLSAATASLARGFHGIKAMLNDRIQKIREFSRGPEPEYRQPEPDGRFVWAREREQQTVEGASWRDSSPSAEPPSRIGAMEMIRRVALAHRINVSNLVIQGNEVRETNVPSGDRPICEIGSVYWTSLEHETLTLHRFAHRHQLDANALYVRDGTVYEENREAFIDRTVCDIASRQWKEVRLAMAAESMRNFCEAKPATTPTQRALPDDDDLVCALASLGEDATVARIDEVRNQLVALRAAQPDQIFTDLVSEVSAAHQAAQQLLAGRRVQAPGALREMSLGAGDESLAPSM